MLIRTAVALASGAAMSIGKNEYDVHKTIQQANNEVLGPKKEVRDVIEKCVKEVAREKGFQKDIRVVYEEPPTAIGSILDENMSVETAVVTGKIVFTVYNAAKYAQDQKLLNHTVRHEISHLQHKDSHKIVGVRGVALGVVGASFFATNPVVAGTLIATGVGGCLAGLALSRHNEKQADAGTITVEGGKIAPNAKEIAQTGYDYHEDRAYTKGSDYPIVNQINKVKGLFSTHPSDQARADAFKQMMEQLPDQGKNCPQ